MKNILVIIPTLNEKGNLKKLFYKIKKNLKNFDILFIDDNSKDGTRNEIDSLIKKNNNIFCIYRKRRLGVGSAHKAGLIYAYRKKYKIVITIDADGTHDPLFIKKMLKKLKKSDLVITNRFKYKKALHDWSLIRILLTKFRYRLINFLLNISYDTSGAFRCYNLKQIKLHHILKAKNNGYSFFWESTYLLHVNKYVINEIPIRLPFRKVGSSKMGISHILHALFYVFYYYFKKINLIKD